jgi:DNA-binding MarR family transcriptional regulator
MPKRLPPGPLNDNMPEAFAGSTALALTRAGALAGEKLERVFRRRGCHVRDYAVLELLAATDPGPGPFYDGPARLFGVRIGMTQWRLRKRIGLSPAALSRLLREIETAGFIKLGFGRDGRERFVELRPPGKELLEPCREALRVSEEEIFEGIDPEHREQLRETCLRLPPLSGRDRNEEWWLRRA